MRRNPQQPLEPTHIADQCGALVSWDAVECGVARVLEIDLEVFTPQIEVRIRGEEARHCGLLCCRYQGIAGGAAEERGSRIYPGDAVVGLLREGRCCRNAGWRGEIRRYRSGPGRGDDVLPILYAECGELRKRSESASAELAVELLYQRQRVFDQGADRQCLTDGRHFLRGEAVVAIAKRAPKLCWAFKIVGQ